MTPAQTRGRFWLYAPYAVVLALLVGWAAIWFVVKGRVALGVDQWFAREAQAGRDWSCADRSIAGFPFRIEVKCSAATLKRPADPSAPAIAMGPLLVVAQVYDPNLIIAEPKAPVLLQWPDGRSGSLSWQVAQLSLRRAGGQLERGSLTLDKPVLTLQGFDRADGSILAARLDAHLRPTPNRGAENAVDIALSLDKLALPALDQLLSSAEPADLKIETTLTQGSSLAGGLTPVTIEAWREAGGGIEFSKLALAKGAAILEAQARLSLDEYRRVRGRLDGAQSGIETVAGMRIGAMLDAGALFAGRPAAQTPAQGGGRSLKPLPPLEARDGRLYLGPLRIPGTPLRPLY